MRLWLIGWLSWGLVTLALPQLRLLWEVPNQSQDGDGYPFVQQLQVADQAGSLYVWGEWLDAYHGTFEGYTYYDALLLKYAPDDRLLWEWRYDGDDNPNDTGTSTDYAANFAINSLGHVLAIAGSRLRSFSWGIFWKFAPDGTVLWQRQDLGFVVIDRLDNMIRVGGSGGMRRIAKYDRDGNLLWERFEQINGYSDVLHGTALDPFGNMLALSRLYELAVAKYSPEAIRLWERFYPTGQDWVLYQRLFVDTGGNAYAVAMTGGQVVAVKYDPDGNLLWSNWYTVPGQDV